MRTAKLLLLCLIAGALLTGCRAVIHVEDDPEHTHLAPRGYKHLGSRTVNFRAEKDTIHVTLRRGTFRGLRIKVTGSRMTIYRMTITFSDGSKHSPVMRHNFRNGAWTRDLNLPGRKRIIRKVEFWYRSKGPLTGKAKVHLYGRH